MRSADTSPAIAVFVRFLLSHADSQRLNVDITFGGHLCGDDGTCRRQARLDEGWRHRLVAHPEKSPKYEPMREAWEAVGGTEVGVTQAPALRTTVPV